MRFSERAGLKPTKNIIQMDSMDDDLKNSLWNILDIFFWKNNKDSQYLYGTTEELLKDLWLNLFKWPLDTLNLRWSNTYQKIRDLYFDFKWWEVYDFIEFINQKHGKEHGKGVFEAGCNKMLERELSAYRFIGGKISPITATEEIEAIEKALTISDKFKNVKIHLRSALEKFSDRKNPDYRNSIKESISAVEAIAILITKEPKASLEKALIVIESKIGLHGALKSAFIKLYGYTSDAEGIRHALTEEPKLFSSDAKFMLVSCSAFINYLIEKIESAGIKV